MAQLAESPDAPNPFAVDPADELPVGLQLSLRLRALIATGRLPAGERLPSVRRLAEWASEQGFPLYLTPHSGTLTVGPSAAGASAASPNAPTR